LVVQLAKRGSPAGKSNFQNNPFYAGYSIQFCNSKKKVNPKLLTFAYDPFESSDDVLFAHGKHIWT
jgi:hypothetical protein